MHRYTICRFSSEIAPNHKPRFEKKYIYIYIYIYTHTHTHTHTHSSPVYIYIYICIYTGLGHYKPMI